MAALAALAAAEVTALAVAAAAAVSGGAGLEAAEKAIRAGLLRLGAGVLEDLLAADGGYAGPAVPCGHGHQAQLVSARERRVDTVLGPVAIRRAWYHCDRCHHGLAPRDGQLGIAGQSMSPGLRKMTARAAAAVPFAAAARLVAELAGVVVTGKRAGRRAEAGGQAAAAVIAAEAEAIARGKIAPLLPAGGPVPDMLYAAIDGTGVPMVAAETEGRAGKGEGRAGPYPGGEDGRRVHPDRRRRGRVPGPRPRLIVLPGDLRPGAGVRQLTILGDGAPWIWNLATQHFPAATQIVDLFHAREHVHDLANLAGRLLAGHRDEWLAARLAELDAGDVPALITASRNLKFTGSLSRERDKALHYFETNAHRMRYAWYRSLGLFVGSGVVEAGCRSVIGQRLKLSGMKWTQPGATGILTLRCQQASNRWEQIWQRPHSQTPAA